MKRALCLLTLVIMAAPATAFPEAEASSVDERIVRVGHAPEVPEPGQQWQGFIELVPDHGIGDVYYQICRVGSSCFAGPTPATQVTPDRWEFDTADYALNFEGEPVPWGMNPEGDEPWLVGVQYIFTQGNQSAADGEKVPHGRDDCLEVPDDEWVECDATHYFTFMLPGQGPAASEGAPSAPLVFTLIALAILAAARRRVS